MVERKPELNKCRHGCGALFEGRDFAKHENECPIKR